jgi:hypothetical protein
MAKRPPKNFIIQISLDSEMKFHYQDMFSQLDATSVAVMNGDRIVWILDPAIPERTLQVDFGVINPFRIYRNVSLRGKGQVITDEVNFPTAYPGNRQLKYTVSLGNGLHDDPDVVPVENDAGLRHQFAFDPPDFKITWKDASDQAVVLSPGALSKSASGGKAPVTWKWGVGATDPTPPFELDFTSPHLPSGWSASTTQSTDSDPAITLLLPPGHSTFKIGTTSGDGANNIWVEGDLTITA